MFVFRDVPFGLCLALCGQEGKTHTDCLLRCLGWAWAVHKEDSALLESSEVRGRSTCFHNQRCSLEAICTRATPRAPKGFREHFVAVVLPPAPDFINLS